MHKIPGFAGHLVCSLLAAVGVFVRPGMPQVRRMQLQPVLSTGCHGSRSTHRPEARTVTKGPGFRPVFACLMLFAVSLMLTTSAIAATPPGTIISNTATIDYVIGGVPSGPTVSNSADLVTRTPATIEFLTSAPALGTAENINVPPTSYSTSGTSAGPFVSLLPPLPGGLSNPVALTPASAYHSGQPLFIRLTDLDQNLDPGAAETILVRLTCIDTGDIEWLLLTETGSSTGQFAGYLPTTRTGPGSSDGSLSVVEDGQVDVSYTDPVDGTDTAATSALVDPTGIVFDSSNGQPLDGVTVTLIDNNTGLPAVVFGDDGISSFPATIVTGGSATDSNGIVYNFPPGGYRFPLIAPGDYRLEVTPPVGYTIPTVVTDAVLQTLPGAPFALVTGSRGEVFTVNPGPVVRIDVPVDPQGDGLWLQKQANHDDATVGDFLQYRLTLENLSSVVPVANVIITDRLPTGFRYQHGSTTIDGVPLADPIINRDGQQLQFGLGNLAAEQRVDVTYVVEITAGTRQGEAINWAQAEDVTGQLSNVAKASVEILPLFFNDNAFLAGRVLSGSCEQDDREMTGVAGVRIFLEDGSYIVTDQNGRYHFEGIEPGVHVVQADIDSLPTGYEMLPCEQTSQTAGRTFSQFVDLQGGTLWRVNFYTAPKPALTGEVHLQMTAGLDAETATFDIDLAAHTVPAENLRLTFMLPGDAQYLPGTARMNSQSISDPEILSGAVTFRIKQIAADQPLQVSFQARLDDSQGSGELPAKAMLMFDTTTAKGQRTPIVETRFHLETGQIAEGEALKLYPRFPSFVAELQKTDRGMLDQLIERLGDEQIVRVDVVGHTDNQPIARRSRHIFADNQALSEARARSVAAYLQQYLDLPETILSVRGLGERMPVADNGTASGRALNRRVELNLATTGDAEPATLSLVQATSERKTVATTGPDPTEGSGVEVTSFNNVLPQPPQIDAAWRATAANKPSLVWPPEGYIPETPSLSVMVQYLRGDRVTLELNGAPVNPLNFDGVKSQNGSDLLVAIWHGVDLRAGQNHITAAIIDKHDNPTATLNREIWFVENAYQVELLPEQSQLLADGLQTPVLALRLTDDQGHPLRPGLYSDIEVAPPHQLRQTDKLEIEEPATIETGQPRFVTGPNGVVFVTLEPTTQSGQVNLTVPLPGGMTQDVRAWLKPSMRDWVLVGFAQGTIGYNTIDGNMQNLKSAGLEEDFYHDGRTKFFAKGAIKGEWLLTMAYDSDKPNLDGESLHQVIDPDTYYPLYGDGTQQGYEAASAENLYIKLERDQFYALFGDFDTGLNVTELSRYSRSLNGFKTEWRSPHFEINAFASETTQAFIKEEIRGDGTSGLYHLSADKIVANSEKIEIETRDRLHNEVIVNSESLSRHIDYEIDYDDGSIFFKKPIPSRDENFNPVFIVVRYETVGSDEAQLNYGGRAAVKLLDERVEIGASYIHEEAGTNEGELVGVDATLKVTDTTTLQLEAARTNTEAVGDNADGTAYLAELAHHSKDLDARLYYRKQDEDFGLGQQNGSESGTRKIGAEASYQATDNFEIGGEVYRLDNLETDATRKVAEADISYQQSNWKVSTGYREARDAFATGEKQRSSQVLAGAEVRFLNNKLALRADHEQSIGDNDENSDFPTRTLLGVDYRLSHKINLFVEQEFTWGDQQDTEGTRVGFSTQPWSGGSFDTSVEQQMTENGRRVFALFGLQQNWQVSEHWSLDAGLDRNQTIKHPGNDSFDTDAAPATGSEDFTSISIGGTARFDNWSWTNRIEAHDAETEDRWGLTTSVVTEPKPGVAFSGKTQVFLTDRETGQESLDADIRFGLAYRPAASRWILLDRLDLYFEREDGSGTDYNSWRLVNNLNANYKPNRRFQISLQYGLKYVQENFDGRSYSGFTDLIGTETRYNITSKLDIGLHGSLLHSWDSGQFDYSAGASIGYAVMENTWVSLGYNLVGFEDEDFSSANYTAQGIFLRFRVKFDQQSVKEAVEWLNR